MKKVLLVYISALLATMSVWAQTFGECGADGNNVIWTLSDGTLTISGEGEMADYYNINDSRQTPWYSSRYGIKTVVIEDGVTSIGEEAFYGCSSLAEITTPYSVTGIGEYAFCDCSSLTQVSIPEGVTSIGEGAFSGCSSLTAVTIPDGVTSIGGSAFFGCSALTQVTIPKGVTSIGNYAFESCSSLTEVTIPEGVTSIESWRVRRLLRANAGKHS